MSEFKDEMTSFFGRGPYKLLAIIGILCGVYILLSLVFSFWPFSVISGLTKSVVNEKAIIQNYQWFYDQYNNIQSQTANYSSIPKEATTERVGLRLVLNQSIGEYNSRSRQITRNLWKADDLPYQINFIKE